MEPLTLYTVGHGKRALVEFLALLRGPGIQAQGATAILCAGRDPAHCHRRLIVDYLTLRAVRVIHLLAAGEQCEHDLSPEARRESAELVYERDPGGQETLFDHP